MTSSSTGKGLNQCNETEFHSEFNSEFSYPGSQSNSESSYTGGSLTGGSHSGSHSGSQCSHGGGQSNSDSFSSYGRPRFRFEFFFTHMQNDSPPGSMVPSVDFPEVERASFPRALSHDNLGGILGGNRIVGKEGLGNHRVVNGKDGLGKDGVGKDGRNHRVVNGKDGGKRVVGKSASAPPSIGSKRWREEVSAYATPTSEDCGTSRYTRKLRKSLKEKSRQSVDEAVERIIAVRGCGTTKNPAKNSAKEISVVGGERKSASSGEKSASSGEKRVQHGYNTRNEYNTSAGAPPHNQPNVQDKQRAIQPSGQVKQRSRQRGQRGQRREPTSNVPHLNLNSESGSLDAVNLAAQGSGFYGAASQGNNNNNNNNGGGMMMMMGGRW